MTYKIGIDLRAEVYVPEAYAYEKYLSKLGHHVQLMPWSELERTNDLNIRFMGFDPFWKKNDCMRTLQVHEYHSLSVPPCAKQKDFFKRRLNKRPSGRIFLNEIVRREFGFSDGVPSIIRDMGVDDEFFSVKRSENPYYDILYCGTFSKRRGLIDEVIKLASLGFKILLIGHVEAGHRRVLANYPNIDMYGKASRHELPELYSNAYAGLNFTPDFYPFNIQTSTKTLEYLAAGLVLISNRYNWIEGFCENNRYKPAWLHQIRKYDDLFKFKPPAINLDRFSWGNLLEESQFESFLINILSDDVC